MIPFPDKNRPHIPDGRAALLRGHHTRRRSNAALPIAPIIIANWYEFTGQTHKLRDGEARKWQKAAKQRNKDDKHFYEEAKQNNKEARQRCKETEKCDEEDKQRHGEDKQRDREARLPVEDDRF